MPGGHQGAGEAATPRKAADPSPSRWRAQPWSPRPTVRKEVSPPPLREVQDRGEAGAMERLRGV
jgi:hypothetical protein